MVTVIAEAGVNHDGSVTDAHAMIEVASRAGADVVKFQTFMTDQLASPDAPKAAYQRTHSSELESSAAMLRRLELPRTALHELSAHAAELGVEFASTPFDVASLQFLVEEVGVRRVKLSSGDLTNALLLQAAARTDLPVIVSTGMATQAEVADALDVLACTMLDPGAVPNRANREGLSASPGGHAALAERVTVLHCTSCYPTAVEDVNLKAMLTLRDGLNLPVGYSDHTLGVAVATAAVALGATVIEKHFTLGRDRSGPDHAASLEPDELRAMVVAVRDVGRALGDGVKRPVEAEAEVAAVARRGMVAARAIGEGDVIRDQDLSILRPARGGDPMDVFDVIGRRSIVSISAGDPVTIESTESASDGR